jgi:hypothetical protein
VNRTSRILDRTDDRVLRSSAMSTFCFNCRRSNAFQLADGENRKKLAPARKDVRYRAFPGRCDAEGVPVNRTSRILDRTDDRVLVDQRAGGAPAFVALTGPAPGAREASWPWRA